jgi:hypothetical protein
LGCGGEGAEREDDEGSGELHGVGSVDRVWSGEVLLIGCTRSRVSNERVQSVPSRVRGIDREVGAP